MKNRLTWVMISVFLFASWALAQSPLPIGKYLHLQMPEWISTNARVRVVLSASVPGGRFDCGTPQILTNLVSYQAYKQYGLDKQNQLLNLAQCQMVGLDATSVTYRVAAVIGGKAYSSFTIPEYEQVTISNIERFVLSAGGIEQDLATNNMAILSGDYLTGTSRARFSVTDTNGQTTVYLQSGEPLEAPTVSLVLGPDGQVSLSVTMTPGADTAVEVSTNLTDWVSIYNNPWTADVSSLSLTGDDWAWLGDSWDYEDWVWQLNDEGEWVPIYQEPPPAPDRWFFRASSW